MSDSRQTRISIPGDDEGGAVDRDQNGGASGDGLSNNSAVDIIVYFMDKVGVHLKVIDGQNIEAGELFELVLDEIPLSANASMDDRPVRDEGLIATAREVFSLWLVSDLLDLQLKSSHVPFKLICYWEELLEKYTSATEEERQRDEPVIMFKRNVFYARSDEKKIENERMMKLLYCEAKDNILRGRYPLSQEDTDRMAGLQAVITLKERSREGNNEQDPFFGTVGYFKMVISEYLPPHLSKRNWFFKTSSNPECRLAQSYSNRLQQRPDSSQITLYSLYREYLEFCWSLRFYGAAFFRGQAEHPGKKNPLSAKVDDPVYVAISVDGVFIIDMDDVLTLVNLFYEKLSWQLVESSNVENPNCLPCLFLQFPDTSRRNYSKLLQIFSREAMLMDNLIEACIQLRRITGTTSSIAARPGDLADIDTARDEEILANFQRLALITLDDSGQIVNEESTVRRPKQSVRA